MSSNDDPAPTDAFDILSAVARQNQTVKMIHPHKGMLLEQQVSIL